MKVLSILFALFSVFNINAQPENEEVDFFLRYRLMFDDKTIVVDNANIELMNNDSGLIYAIDPTIDNSDNSLQGFAVISEADQGQSFINTYYILDTYEDQFHEVRKGLVRINVQIPKLDYRSIFYELARLNIFLVDVLNEERFYDLWDLLETDNIINEKLIMEKLMSDIKLTAVEMREQMESPLVEEGPFSGNDLFTLMENVEISDLSDFLDYLIARPRKYMGEDWKISEVYATWIVSGAPRVVKN
ncbi:MAG: hypothetical protein HOF35_16955 [Bacteroidetes bacterium]|jgi:hypothetical protein|nr:hypothetical protein [Bacteroidota bacterium]MBT4729006.1 hypothetical protein [Bacteroidota bacterium]MBT5991190.1 hypothetical protein [Bacteroidota bacterium]MBT6837996.1 hypothetical protein [Bacteroidota bacterium]MBT7825150.1 hypothetical protein [Bacteroidota bacterium]